MDFAVIHQLRTRGAGTQRVLALVREAPPKTRPTDVRELLTAAGEWFGAGGVAWANHTVRAATDEDRTGREMTWAELEATAANPPVVQLNVRIPKPVQTRIAAAAEGEGVSVQEWVRRALLDTLEAPAG